MNLSIYFVAILATACAQMRFPRGRLPLIPRLSAIPAIPAFSGIPAFSALPIPQHAGPTTSTFAASLGNAPVGIVDRSVGQGYGPVGLPSFGLPYLGFPSFGLPYLGMPFAGFPYTGLGENIFSTSLGDAKVGTVSRSS